jgi:hypothetical protein
VRSCFAVALLVVPGVLHPASGPELTLLSAGAVALGIPTLVLLTPTGLAPRLHLNDATRRD